MDLFGWTIVVGAAVAAVAVAVHWLAAGRRGGGPKPARHPARWPRWANALAAVGLAGLAATGFGPALWGSELGGWLLMVHCAAGPAFAIGYVASAVAWSERCRLARGSGGGIGGVRKVVFWLMLPLAAVVILCPMLSMLSVFGTEGQEWLAEVHRYGGVGLAMLALFRGYLALVAFRGVRPSASV